jgi:hypothetical protein
MRDLWRLIGRFDKREGKFKMKMDSFQSQASSQVTPTNFSAGTRLYNGLLD